MRWSSLIPYTNTNSQKLWNAYWENDLTQKFRYWANKSPIPRAIFHHGLHGVFKLHKTITKLAGLLGATILLALPVYYLIQLFLVAGAFGKIIIVAIWLFLISTSFLLGLHLWIADQIKRIVDRDNWLNWISKGIAFISINVVGAAVISLVGIAVGPSLNGFSASGVSFGDTINVIGSRENVEQATHSVTERSAPVKKNDIISCSAPEPCNPVSKSPPPKNTFRLVGSTDFPISWKIGSASQIVLGMSNKETDWQMLGFNERLCDIGNLFVIGTASGDGKKINNEKLAIARANHIAQNAGEVLEHCIQTPKITIIKVTLGESQIISSDGWSRRVIAFSSTVNLSKGMIFDEIRDVVTESAKENFRLKVSDYGTFQICVSTWPELNCDWRSQ